MKIEKDCVVRFHYAVSEPGQEALENSRGGEPLAILQGHGNIIPGLERAMEGHEAGDTFSVDVPAADASARWLACCSSPRCAAVLQRTTSASNPASICSSRGSCCW